MAERTCPSCDQGLGSSWGRCPHCGARFSELLAAVNRKDMRTVVVVVSAVAIGVFGIMLAIQ